MSENDEVAAFYDEHGEHLGLTPEFDHLDPVLADVSEKRVLDAGCGVGTVAAELDARGADVVGIDVSERLVAIAEKRHGDAVRFRHADFTEPLAFLDDGAFDLVVCLLALAHVDDWDRPFETFHRVLRSGGAAVVHTHHPFVDYLEVDVEDADEVTADAADYSAVERFGRRWGPGGETMPFYRRPLGEYLRPALEAGFVLETFVEPNAGDHESDRYDSTEPPRHLLYRLRKPSTNDS